MTYLDTRDLYAELTDLQERAADPDDHAAGPLDDIDTARMAALVDLFEEIGESAGRYGEVMVPVDDFADYAQDYAEDIHGDTIRDLAWPMSHIDWESAASSLAQDYTEVEFDGVSYYVRLD